MMNPIRITILLLALLAAGTATAGGDADAGRNKAYTCLGCHAVKSYFNVYPSYHVPRIGGQHAAYLEAALQAYKNGQRSHPTMRAQASNLSDQDIADIAAYFASFGK